MQETIKTVVVIGASGNVGRAITDALVATNQFVVSALTRNTTKAAFPPSVKAMQTDYSATSLSAAFAGQDAVISAIATSSLMEQQGIVDAAVAAGVKRFIPSEFGFDSSTDKTQEIAPPLVMKRDVVKYLRSKESEGMAWTTFCCGMWFDWSFTAPDFPFWDLESRTFTKFDDGTAPFEASNVSQVGKAVAASLMPAHLAETKNQYVFTHSFTATQNEMLAAVEKYTGATCTIKHAAIKPFAASGKEKFARALSSGMSVEELGQSEDFVMGVVETIIAGIFGNGGVNQFAERAKMWNARLGLQDEDLDETVRRVVAEHGKASRAN